MPLFNVTDDVKGLREALCEAQSQINGWMPGSYQSYSRKLQELIDECDRHRPLGPDGKHGGRHTATCGCEDKGHSWWCDHRDCDGCAYSAPASLKCVVCFHDWANEIQRKADW